MGTFRPSARVRLQLRLEELADLEPLKDKLERDPGGAGVGPSPGAGVDRSATLRENAQKRQLLEQQRGTLSPPSVAAQRSLLDQERRDAQLSGGPAQTKPAGLQERPDDARNVIFDMLPVEVEIRRNEVQDAHTAIVTFDFRDVPVDPRSVRSALVSVALGTVSADEFSRGVVSGDRRQDGSPVSVVEYTPGQELDFRSTTRFVGFAEEWRTDFSEEGDLLVLDCKDVSAILRDKELPIGVVLDRTLPLADGVQQLIDMFVESRGIQVRFGTLRDGDPLESLGLTDRGPVPIDSAARVQKSRKGKRGRGKAVKAQKLWDHITHEVQRLGFVVVMRGFALYILEASGLYGNTHGRRRMVYGRNLVRLQFARKLLGVKVPTIEVRCPDPDIGRTRWARYPVLDGEPTSGVLGVSDPVVSRPSQVSPNGSAEEEVLIHNVSGISDAAVLERIARNVFEQVGRQEIEGGFETEDIDSFRDPDDPLPVDLPDADLLDLHPGEPVDIEIAPPAQVSELALESRDQTQASLQELVAQGAARRASYLEAQGLDPETAQRLAAAQELIPLSDTFRVGYVNLIWNADDGVSIECDFHNFIVVRELAAEQQVRFGVEQFLAGVP